MWYKLAILAVILFSSCGKDSVRKSNSAAKNTEISDSDYIIRDSTISVSSFIALKRTADNKWGNVFNRIPVNLSDQNAFSDFEINTICDTIFMKYEHLLYKWHTRHLIIDEKGWGAEPANEGGGLEPRWRSEPKEFFQLLVWNKHKMIYFDDNKTDLLELSETSSEKLKESNDRFFNLVENWDTVKLNKRKCKIITTMSTIVEPTVILRVIFNRGSYSIDKYEFRDLYFPKDRLRFRFLDAGRPIKVARSYYALIEDILFYRHFRGLPSAEKLSLEDKEKKRQQFRQKRKEDDMNPEFYEPKDIDESNNYIEVITIDSSPDESD